MHRLVIRNIEGGPGGLFCVVRGSDGKTTSPVAIASPGSTDVGTDGAAKLDSELRWYLEQFLEYPFPPLVERAERVREALRAWGERAFDALFGSGLGRDCYSEAHRAGLENLHLHIVSNDPAILGWPWEALRDRGVGTLAHACRIERRLDAVRDPIPLPQELPKDRINILLITARPYDGDVGYRSLSRPIVEVVREGRLPARVTVLRPPTFPALREHLRNHPHRYHIVHFDGHGAFSPQPLAEAGRLIFEDSNGGPQEVDAEQLSALLREHCIPVMVLNACQSAMLDGGAEDVFASVATALLRAGVRGVVAMAYSLYVSGAEVFLPAFYGRLFETGNLAEAMRAGRQQMLAKPQRICARGRCRLDDWLVPVLYQLEAPNLPFASKTLTSAPQCELQLTDDARDEENPYGFIGRDSALLALERALRRKPAGLLIHGLGGIGKTTLARGFVHWLAATDGLGQGVIWFTFNDIRSSEHVVNRLVEHLFGSSAMTASTEEKLKAVIHTLREQPFVIVWDNFESVSGVSGVVEANLPPEDRAQLRTLLNDLRGGFTKILITSRSEEAWLSQENCFKLALGGLQGEERWIYCATILEELGLRAAQNDPELVALMDLLDGHPLAMRAILPGLAQHNARALADIVRGHLKEFAAEEPAQQRLFATLRFVEETLPASLCSLLLPIALHERFVDAVDIEAMARSAEPNRTRAEIDQCLAALGTAGLVHDRSNSWYEMHPLLTGYLRTQTPALQDNAEADAWRRAFVDLMGWHAHTLVSQSLYQLGRGLDVHGANFHMAFALAESLRMNNDLYALANVLGACALNRRDFPTATRYFSRLAQHCLDTREEGEHLAAAYHQLGTVAQAERDFDAATEWYKKSLAITEKLGIEHGAAGTYQQLGVVAQAQYDFKTAKHWYRKSLSVTERLGDLGSKRVTASTYHNLGIIAQEQQELRTADTWYHKALELDRDLGDEHGVAATYHQLGSVALEHELRFVAQAKRDFRTAIEWYKKSLDVKEMLGDARGMASTYHQLGRIAEEQSDFDGATNWYVESLNIEERLGEKLCAAWTYHQLGNVALEHQLRSIAPEKRDFRTAIGWYQKSLEIKEKFGDARDAASTYHQLGRVAQEQGDFSGATEWYRRSLDITEKLGDDHSAALTHCQLGLNAGVQGLFIEAAEWMIRGIHGLTKSNDDQRANQAKGDLLWLYARAPGDERQSMRQLCDEAGLGRLLDSQTD